MQEGSRSTYVKYGRLSSAAAGSVTISEKMSVAARTPTRRIIRRRDVIPRSVHIHSSGCNRRKDVTTTETLRRRCQSSTVHYRQIVQQTPARAHTQFFVHPGFFCGVTPRRALSRKRTFGDKHNKSRFLQAVAYTLPVTRSTASK